MAKPQWARIQEWEYLYREYQSASNDMARLRPPPTDVIERYARVSQEVATAWRALLPGEKQPWWIVAAVESAAQAFAEQAKRWAAVAAGEIDKEGGSVPPRARPYLQAIQKPAERHALRPGKGGATR
ncbi:hypothetical protein ACPZ19_13110 [Amycolatopsis lurida]